MEELASIVDYGRYDPAINPAFGCHSSDYWSGSTDAYNPAFAWVVSFDGGPVNTHGKTNWYYYCVRCVRSGP
jgi:hypothetical protein